MKNIALGLLVALIAAVLSGFIVHAVDAQGASELRMQLGGKDLQIVRLNERLAAARILALCPDQLTTCERSLGAQKQAVATMMKACTR